MFLKNLKLYEYFNPITIPTLKEIQILCAMREDDSIKFSARVNDISIATAANHISNLKDKLLKPHYLHEIIIKLRSLPIDTYKYGYTSTIQS